MSLLCFMITIRVYVIVRLRYTVFVVLLLIVCCCTDNNNRVIWKQTGERDIKITYDSNGKVLREEQYANGKRNGTAREFYPNGKPYIVASYKNDSLVGEFFMY